MRSYLEQKCRDRVLKFRSRLSPERLLKIIQKFKSDVEGAEETKVGYHARVIKYLEKKVEGKQNPEEESSQSLGAEPEKVLAGTKRLHPVSFNAVKNELMTNPVENAFMRRPNSPKGFRIYSDK